MHSLHSVLFMPHLKTNTNFHWQTTPEVQKASRTSQISATSCSSIESPSIEISEPSSPGLPPEDLMAQSELELDKLKADLEHCLDLRSIMKGKKHIRADVSIMYTCLRLW